MSELPHSNTTGQLDPSVYKTAGEITREQVLNASASEISVAAHGEAGRLEGIQSQLAHGGAEWNGIQASRINALRVAQQAGSIYRAVESRYSSFGDWASERMDDALLNEDGEKAVQYQEMADWVDGPIGQRTIGEVLRSKVELTAADEVIDAPIETPRENAQAVVDHQKKAVDSARSSVEQAHTVELFDKIVRLGKNRTLLETDIVQGFMFIGDGGKQNDKFMYMQRLDALYRRDTKVEDWQQELNEVAMFSDIVEQARLTVTTDTSTKGRFGRIIKSESTSTEAVPGSEHPKLIRNEVTGQDEPAVRFRYRFMYGSKTANQEQLPKYREFGGQRRGQHIHASVELPKSVADALQEQVRRDPSVARSVAEKLFLNNSDGTMTTDLWHQGKATVKHPIRPPYEDLPAGWNVAVVTAQETEQYGRPNILKYAINRVPLNSPTAQ